MKPLLGAEFSSGHRSPPFTPPTPVAVGKALGTITHGTGQGTALAFMFPRDLCWGLCGCQGKHFHSLSHTDRALLCGHETGECRTQMPIVEARPRSLQRPPRPGATPHAILRLCHAGGRPELPVRWRQDPLGVFFEPCFEASWYRPGGRLESLCPPSEFN